MDLSFSLNFSEWRGQQQVPKEGDKRDLTISQLAKGTSTHKALALLSSICYSEEEQE